MKINYKHQNNGLTTNTWKAFSDDMEVSVVWPEVMTPLGAAMNLIYSQPSESASLVHLLQLGHKLLTLAALLRGNIEQFQ